MFDLPMDTAKEKRIYQLFRKGLIKEGFVMMQYSVYVRTCPTREYSTKATTFQYLEELSYRKTNGTDAGTFSVFQYLEELSYRKTA